MNNFQPHGVPPNMGNPGMLPMGAPGNAMSPGMVPGPGHNMMMTNANANAVSRRFLLQPLATPQLF
jgi:collagen type III alpha